MEVSSITDNSCDLHGSMDEVQLMRWQQTEQHRRNALLREAFGGDFGVVHRQLLGFL